MKKSLVILFLIAGFMCNISVLASEPADYNAKEIHLDLNTGFKEYKIKQPEENNDNRTHKDSDDDDLPFEMVTSPLQLLKQYNAGQY